MGYFGGVYKQSRGPWFRAYWVEDDGLDWYYSFTDSDGAVKYLLSNNMKLEDRENMAALYKSMNRNNKISWFLGLFLGVETICQVNYFRTMASGWRVLSLFGLGFLYKSAIMQQSSLLYKPTIQAYLRKYNDAAKSDLFEIEDERRRPASHPLSQPTSTSTTAST